jgi:hypothetical protein
VLGYNVTDSLEKDFVSELVSIFKSYSVILLILKSYKISTAINPGN